MASSRFTSPDPPAAQRCAVQKPPNRNEPTTVDIMKALTDGKGGDAVEMLNDDPGILYRMESKGYNPLAAALENSSAEVVEALLQRGADPNNKFTHPLQVLVPRVDVMELPPWARGAHDMQMDCSDALAKLRIMLRYGANPRMCAADQRGLTLTQRALRLGWHDFVDTLTIWRDATIAPLRCCSRTMETGAAKRTGCIRQRFHQAEECSTLEQLPERAFEAILYSLIPGQLDPL